MTTGKNKGQDSLDHWHDVLGTDADRLWQALDVEPHQRAMTVFRPARDKVWIARLKLAAVLACFTVMALWQWQSVQQLQHLHTENLTLRLDSQNPVWQLEALQLLSELPGQQSRLMFPAVMRLLVSASDPNVQLGALEILVREGVIRSPDDIPTLATPRSQAQFITASFDRLFHH